MDNQKQGIKWFSLKSKFSQDGEVSYSRESQNQVTIHVRTPNWQNEISATVFNEAQILELLKTESSK